MAWNDGVYKEEPNKSQARSRAFSPKYLYPHSLLPLAAGTEEAKATADSVPAPKELLTGRRKESSEQASPSRWDVIGPNRCSFGLVGWEHLHVHQSGPTWWVRQRSQDLHPQSVRS